MQNDSIDTLLLRHYGRSAPTPAGLEEGVRTALHRQVVEQQREQQQFLRWRQQRISRRRLLRVVAVGTAGVGVVGIGLESLHQIRVALSGQDITRPAYS